MNGVIKMNDAGTIKSFKVDFVRDMFFGATFMGKLWYEESRKEWHGLTSKVSLKYKKNKKTPLEKVDYF